MSSQINANRNGFETLMIANSSVRYRRAEECRRRSRQHQMPKRLLGTRTSAGYTCEFCPSVGVFNWKRLCAVATSPCTCSGDGRWPVDINVELDRVFRRHALVQGITLEGLQAATLTSGPVTVQSQSVSRRVRWRKLDRTTRRSTAGKTRSTE